MIWSDLTGMAHSLTPEIAHAIFTRRKFQLRLVHYIVTKDLIYCPDISFKAGSIESLDQIVSNYYNALENTEKLNPAAPQYWNQLEKATFVRRRRVVGCFLMAIVLKLPEFKGWN